MNNEINFELAEKNYKKDLLENINFFRNIAAEIDENPSNILNYSNHEAVSRLCFDRSSTCYTRTKILEAFSYGDAGVLLACPGPSLSGLMLRELGNEAQKEYFFNYVEKNKCTTFLALTEPNKGSDAGHLESYLYKNSEKNYLLSGEKWLVGHGADAPIGVLVARTSKGPLGITAILLTPEMLAKDKVYRHHLETIGLRGARLSRLFFEKLMIDKNCFLGLHLNPMQRGMMAVMKTFNRMRPGVAAFAIGQAQAIIDYVITYRNKLSRFEKIKLRDLNNKISIARLILYDACRKVDKYPYENVFASIVKIKATQIAEENIFNALDFFGKNAIFEHPLLLKWYRDVFGFEYMEGTSHMQLQNIFYGFKNNKLEIKNKVLNGL